MQRMFKVYCSVNSIGDTSIMFYSCCRAKQRKLPTCTNPLAELSRTNRFVYCPIPPVLSLNDVTSDTQLTGPLDNINVYVAERLLSISDQLGASIFNDRFQVKFLNIVTDINVSINIV